MAAPAGASPGIGIGLGDPLPAWPAKGLTEPRDGEG